MCYFHEFYDREAINRSLFYMKGFLRVLCRKVTGNNKHASASFKLAKNLLIQQLCAVTWE